MAKTTTFLNERLLFHALSLAAFIAQLSTAFGQGTAFTYQGRLNDGANPANGFYDFQFALYDGPSDPLAVVSVTNTLVAVPVSNGLFTVSLDFGDPDSIAILDGQQIWLGIAVRTNAAGPGGYTTLAPRTMFTPTPYAIFAGNAGTASSAKSLSGHIAASQITGIIASSNIGVGTITSTNLAPGAAAANLAASGITGVPSSGIVLSEREVNQKLLDAGFSPVGLNLSGGGESWTTLSNGPPATGAISPGRYNYQAVWSGTEMLIIGGTPDNLGLRYNPTANTWIVMSQSNAPAIGADVQAAWSGTQLIVWDAYHRVGGRYSPSTDSWQPISDTNAPSARNGASSGSGNGYFVVWGGSDVSDDKAFLNTGGRYNPINNTWVATSIVNVPQRRAGATGTTIGTDIIFFGGVTTNTFTGTAIPGGPYSIDGVGALASGGRYNPSANSWTTIANAPSDRTRHTATWSGTYLLVWGGVSKRYSPPQVFQPDGSFYDQPMDSGMRYNPTTDSWSNMSTNGEPGMATGHSAVWSSSGSLMIWGGDDQSTANGGFRYVQATDSWVPMAIPAGSERGYHGAVWSGSQMVVWGGKDDSGNELSDGLRYTLASDTWSSTANPPPTGEPSERTGAAAVWTGDAFIVWGGFNGTNHFRSGGIYRPESGWTSMPVSGAPAGRNGHTAIWTGKEMIVWGGQSQGFLPVNTGARFNVASNRWYAMTTLNAPRARIGHTAVWTGTEMIVFGGFDFTNVFYPTFLETGARYNPATDTWTPIPSNFFAAGAGHSAVWTGTEMLTWGGYTHNGGLFPTYVFSAWGFRYDPVANQWNFLPFTTLSPRAYHTAVWSGSEMLVWGGQGASGLVNTGARFNPTLNTWSDIPTNNAPTSRQSHAAVWADLPGQMIVWGGFQGLNYLASGALYDPAVNKWTTMTNTTPPLGRDGEVWGWTGNQMLIFDGGSQFGYLSDGSAFTPRKTFYLYQKP